MKKYFRLLKKLARIECIGAFPEIVIRHAHFKKILKQKGILKLRRSYAKK